MDGDRLTLLVEVKLQLLLLKLDRTVLEALLPQSLGYLIQLMDRLLHLGRHAGLTIDHLQHLLVLKSVVAVDHRAGDVVVEHSAEGIDAEDAGECGSVHTGTEGAEIVAEPLRQHRHGAID